MKWTIKHLDQLMKAGKIRDYKINTKTPEKKSQKSGENIPGRKVTRHWPKRSKEKDWLAQNLLMWCNSNCLELVEEYRFHPERKWKSDWFVKTPKHNILIEFEGLMSEKSRHTTLTGYSGDTEKYRTASMMGFMVLRYTVLNYRDVMVDLNKLLNEHL